MPFLLFGVDKVDSWAKFKRNRFFDLKHTGPLVERLRSLQSWLALGKFIIINILLKSSSQNENYRCRH